MTCLFTQSCDHPVDFYLLDHSSKSIEDYQGRWLIINFWAEWCAPCRKEVPELNHLYADRFTLNLDIVGVSYDPLPNDDISTIVSQWEINYPIMKSDPMPILPFGLPKSLPSNYIFDPRGKLVAQLKGEQTYDSVSKLLISLRKESAKSK